MGEERVGFPSDFFLLLFLLPLAKKRNVNEEEGGYIAVLFTSPRSKGGEKEELQE